MKKKKALIICCVVIAALAVISAGLYIAGNLYYSSSRIYEQTWDIDLPNNMQEKYEAKSDSNFLGDGVRYTIYHLSSNDDFLKDFQTNKDTSFESSFADGLNNFDETLNVPANQQPNWEHKYIWKQVEKYENHLYMVYDQQTEELFILQVLI